MTIETDVRPTHLEEVEFKAHNFTSEVVLSFCYRIQRRDSGVEVSRLTSDVFPPSEKWSRKVRLDPTMQLDKSEDPTDLFEFNYWFTDSRGYNWHRVDRNQPEQIMSTPAEEWERFNRAWVAGTGKN